SPYGGRSREEILDRILSSSPLSPCYINCNLAPAFSSFIIDLLEEVYSNPGEVIDELERLQAGDKLLADDEQRQKNRQTSSRHSKVHEFRNQARFFFKNTGKYVVIGLLCLVVFGYIFYPRGPEQVITGETSYREVVKYFYRGLDEKQAHYLEQSTVRDVEGLDRMLTETFVMEQMRKFYGSMNLDESENLTTGDGEQKESPGAEEQRVMGLEELEITEIEAGESPVFEVDYLLFAGTGEEKKYYRLQDRLELSRVDGVWKITSLEGDIESLINRGGISDDMEEIE
ncbi:MAG: hypothetical protein ACOC5A_01825, partial [Halanaerobiales bacterium]